VSSKRGQRRRKCKRNGKPKQPHETMQEAVAEARRLKLKHPADDFDAYHCRTDRGGCGKYHVGNRTETVRRAIAERRGEV
jgi:hypothetical protein